MESKVPRAPRVLIVDREVESVAGCLKAFRENDFEVHVASSFLEGATFLRTREYDAVVTDLRLPDDDGLKLMHLAHDLSPDVPVLVVTDAPTLETAVTALEMGAARYLVRPVAPQTMLHAVWSAIVRRERSMDTQRRISIAPADEDLKAALLHAMENLYMVFQPIVSWADRRIVAYEALVRTREPSLTRPDLLFAAAEKFELVIAMGRKIRAAVAEHIKDAPLDTDVFVNVHGAELADEDLYSPRAPLSRVADRVVLEITERWSLDRFQDVRERMKMLRSIGFRVAVDDLGAGYAGLTSFAKLRPEVVKLDMSLVRGVNQDPTRQHLVRSLNSLCVDLGIRVVAEGIETAEERDTLVSLGSDLLQGYLFSKPAPAFPQVNWGESEARVSIPRHRAFGAPTHADLGDLRDTLGQLLELITNPASGDKLHQTTEHLSVLGQKVLRGLDRLLESSTGRQPQDFSRVG